MTEKPKFICDVCGCEYEWHEEDGAQCHCFWDDDPDDLDFDFEETMGTA